MGINKSIHWGKGENNKDGNHENMIKTMFQILQKLCLPFSNHIKRKKRSKNNVFLFKLSMNQHCGDIYNWRPQPAHQPTDRISHWKKLESCVYLGYGGKYTPIQSFVTVGSNILQSIAVFKYGFKLC